MKPILLTKSIHLCVLSALITIISSCTGSSRVSDSDFETLQFDIVESASTDYGYSVIVSGFSEDKPSLYNAVHKKLRHYYPDQVSNITESGQNGSRTLSANISNDPKSVNRVLWLFGVETYRHHHLEYKPEAPESGYVIMTQMPELIGGTNELQKKVRYPTVLEGSGIEGQVDLKFMINEFGEVTEPEVIQSLHESADSEAIRVIREAKFKPGIVDGLPVRVQFNMPVFFRDR